MSKLYYMQRGAYGVEAGGIFSVIGGIAKGIGSLFKKKAPQVIAKAKQLGPTVAAGAASGAAWAAGQELLGGGGKGPWTAAAGYMPKKRRRRGITATELRGYRKVANLLHKEGMVSRRARGRR